MSIPKSTRASGRPTRTVDRRTIDDSVPTGREDETGTALVGTFVGATIFLILLLFSTQFLVRLYAISVLTSAAFDAADQVATSEGDAAAEIPLAEAGARQRLGSLGSSHTTFIWREVDAQRIVLEVRAQSPGFVPLPAAYRQIDRTVTVRTEQFR
jgi:Flp pilus assembly protein TadG